MEQDSRTWCPALTMWDSPSPAWSTARQNQHVRDGEEPKQGNKHPHAGLELCGAGRSS